MSKKKKNNQPALDLELIQSSVAQLGLAALTGQSVPTERVTITVDIPKPLLDIATHVASVSGGTREDAVAQMVKEGLSDRLKSLTQDATEETPSLSDLIPKSANISAEKTKDVLEKFQGNMGELTEMVGKLNEISEALNGMGISGDLLKIK